jgi:hypothetical protein
MIHQVRLLVFEMNGVAFNFASHSVTFLNMLI